MKNKLASVVAGNRKMHTDDYKLDANRTDLRYNGELVQSNFCASRHGAFRPSFRWSSFSKSSAVRPKKIGFDECYDDDQLFEDEMVRLHIQETKSRLTHPIVKVNAASDRLTLGNLQRPARKDSLPHKPCLKLNMKAPDGTHGPGLEPAKEFNEISDFSYSDSSREHRTQLRSCMKSRPRNDYPPGRIHWDEKVMVAPTFGPSWYDRKVAKGNTMTATEQYEMYEELVRYKITEMYTVSVENVSFHITTASGTIDYAKAKVVDSILSQHLLHLRRLNAMN